MVEIRAWGFPARVKVSVSVLYREPMWLKSRCGGAAWRTSLTVSVLYREPMWLKFSAPRGYAAYHRRFQCSTVSRCG